MPEIEIDQTLACQVPEEFLREEQVFSVYQSYKAGLEYPRIENGAARHLSHTALKELQSQFKATHSHVEQDWGPYTALKRHDVRLAAELSLELDRSDKVA